MKLEKWALIAELVSGVAVVVTLVFLIQGIQENTEVTRATAYDRNIDSLNEWRMARVRNPEINRLAIAFFNSTVDTLSDDDVALLLPYIQTLFGIYEKSYFAFKYGVLGASEWSRFSNQICLQHDRVIAQGLSVFFSLTGEFVAYMEDECTVHT